MAISLYIGKQGSGKSYEIVKSVIIPAIAKGRRVVTNVYGLDETGIHDYCIRHKLCTPDITMGAVILVDNERIMQPDFYPVMDSERKTLCQAGDVVIIDECNRFFSTDAKLSPDVRSFAAEHRHFVSVETGFTTDFILINQGLSTIPRYFKERVDYVYRMKKLDIVYGFKKKYRVDVFSGTRLVKDSFLNSYINTYDPEIFPLYQSYHGGVQGAEDKTDGRNVLFKKSTLFIYLVFLVLSVLAVMKYVVPFFSGKSDRRDKSVVSYEQQNNVKPASGMVSGVVHQSSSVISLQWCVSGTYFDGERNYVLLRDISGHLRMVSRSNFQGDGIMLHGVVDGQQVNTWSCNNGVSL